MNTDFIIMICNAGPNSYNTMRAYTNLGCYLSGGEDLKFLPSVIIYIFKYCLFQKMNFDTEDMTTDQVSSSVNSICQSEFDVSNGNVIDHAMESTEGSAHATGPINGFNQHSTSDDIISNEIDKEYSFWVHMREQLIGINANPGLLDKELTSSMHKLRYVGIIVYLSMYCLLIMVTSFIYWSIPDYVHILRFYIVGYIFAIGGFMLAFNVVGMTIDKLRIYIQKHD